MHSTIQMKPYSLGCYSIAQCKELYYSIMLIKCQANGHKPIQQTFILLRVHQYALIEQSIICAYCMAWCIALLPRKQAWRVKQSLCSYISRHENRHFGKSRNLGDLLASLFSWSLQKTAYSSIVNILGVTGSFQQ